jgi:hypothetical protein
LYLLKVVRSWFGEPPVAARPDELIGTDGSQCLVAGADEGAKEIFGTDVGAYLSSGNGAVQQDAGRFRQPFQ